MPLPTLLALLAAFTIASEISLNWRKADEILPKRTIHPCQRSPLSVGRCPEAAKDGRVHSKDRRRRDSRVGLSLRAQVRAPLLPELQPSGI